MRAFYSLTRSFKIVLLFTVFFAYYSNATDYYVNDAAFNEVGSLCSVAGAAGNTGLLASSPKATIAQILALGSIRSTDKIYVDVGTYASESELLFGNNDDYGFTIEGVLVAGVSVSVFNYGGGNAHFLNLDRGESDNVTIKNLYVKGYKPTGGTSYGGFINNSASTGGDGIANGWTIQDCIIDDCDAVTSGGAIYWNDLGTYTISGTTFKNCNAASGGAILSIQTLTLTKCVFTANTTTGNGIAIYLNTTSNTNTFTNCLFYANTGGNSNGTIYVGSTSQTLYLYNCTLAYNTTANSATYFGGLYNHVSASSTYTYAYNCVGYGNDQSDFHSMSTSKLYMYYSCYNVSNATGATTGSLSATNPLFVNSGSNNYRLSSTSPCINTATGSPGSGSYPSNDLDGDTRAGAIDMGCYEFDCTTSYQGTYYVGTTGTWTTLTSALSALKSCMIDDVILELEDSYRTTQEASETYPLDFSGLPTSASVKLTIRPKSNVASTITLDANSLTTIIDFDGTNYVTIDGRPGGSGSTSRLTIENTSAAGASLRAVVIDNNSTYDTIKYCTLLSDNNSTTVGTSGVVYIGDGTTGNNSNVIENCNLSYATTATKCLIINNNTTGTTTPLTISNCSFYDYGYRAIWNETGGSAFTISTNNFYLTSTIDPGAFTSSAIFMNAGSGYTISSNTIGGSNSSAGSTAYTISSASASRFVPIYVYQTSANTTSIQGNIIKNISLSTTDGSATTYGTFTGIYVDNATNASATGTLNIGTTSGNVIGDTTASANNDITITSTTSAGHTKGIALLSDGTTSVQNNLIGDFNTSNVAAKGYTIYGISTGGTGTMTVSLNKIGSLATPNSIVIGGASTAGGVCSFYGIYNNGTGVATLSSNSLGNVSVYGTSTSNLIYGIYNNANTTATSYIQSNTITALDMAGASTSSNSYIIANTSVNAITISSNSMTSFTATAGNFYGIYDNAAATGAHSVSSNTLDTVSIGYSTATFKGIELVLAGTYTCSSNTIKNITSSVTGTIYGLAFSAASTVTANSNVVKTITTNIAASNTIIGIYCASTGTYNLSGNNLADFTNASTGAGAPTIAGIKFNVANASSTVEKNRMTGYASGNTSGPKIYGIWNNSTGTTLMYNNLFVCSNGAYTNECFIVGILDGTSISAGTAAITTLYYNTISITGSTASGSTNATTACFAHYQGTADKIQAIKNNIFNNQRTVTAGTSRHYCYWVGSASNIVVTAGAIDYNYYSAPNDTYFAYPATLTTASTFNASTRGYGGTSSKYYTSTSGNSSAITVNTDGTLGSSDYGTVAVGADLADIGPNITTDINGKTRAHVHASGTGGYKGCMEGAPGTYYWVGGTGNWSDAPNHWAYSSGGVACASSSPSSTSTVYFDGNSQAGTCTIDATAYTNDLTMTGYTGTLTGSSNLDIYGSLTVGSGMTWTHSGTATFKSTTTGKTITSNGITIASPLTFNGSGGEWTLQDNLTLSTTSALTLTAGTLDLSSRTLSIAGDFTKATAFTFTPNTGTVTFTGNSSVINGTTAAPTFYNVIVNKTAGQTLSTGGSVTSMTCSNNFTETTGNFTAPTNMTVSGNVTLTAGTFTAPSSTLSVVGNFVNNGATFTHNSGTVSFDGTTTQTVTPNGIGVGNQFYNVTINNSYATPSNTYSVDASAIYVANTTTVTDGQFYPTTGSYFKDVTIGASGILKPRASATIYVSGNWTNSGTFTCNTGTVEFNGTSTINSGGIVSANEFYKVILNGTSATLSSNSIDINNNFTITLGTFSVGSHNMYIGANWVNNGTFSAGTGKVIFNGSTSRTVTGSSVTSFYDLEIDKGTDVTSILDITVASNVTHDVVFTAGLLRLTHSSAIISADDISYNTDISSGAGLHLNGGSYTNGDNYVLNNSGYFRVTSGTATVGTATDNTMYNESATSVFILDGGTLNCAGRFRSALGSTTISSGTLTANTAGGENIATRGVFEIETGSDFSMSGGTVILQTPNPNASGNDLYIVSGGTKTITGGTFQIGNASTAAAQSFKINSDISLYNLTINTTNSPTAILQQNTTVSNDFINGGVFDAKSGSNYSLTIGGGFTNNGTFTARTGTVIFNGGAAQTIAGTTDPNFYNYTLSNASGASLALNTTVQGAFTFTSGLFTTQGYTLTIGTNGTNGSVSGYTSSRYFVAYDSGTIGSVKQFINLKASTAYVYPIGDLTNYTPFTLTVNAASTLAAGAYFTMYTKAATISGLNASVTTYLTRFWRGTDSGITTPDYDISYTYSASDVIGGTEANLMPIKKSGTTWYKPTGSSFTTGTAVGTGGFTVGTRTLTWAGLTSFSDYGGVGPMAVGLPIELTMFEGKKSGRNNELFWRTQTENNNDYFTIEKTIDGVAFEIVGTQNGAGNSSSVLNYNLVDQNVQKVINYYRLIQTDTDGKNTISNLISIDNRELETSEKIVSSITNILGQEINDAYRGLVIITYTDGSSIKTIR